VNEPASLTTALFERIARAIEAAGGWLPFDRFMAMALYEPGLGYYANTSPKFGHLPQHGSDFVTAPELSPLFGRTLARQVAQALQATQTRQVWEFGAGSGALALQVIDSGLDLGTPPPVGQPSAEPEPEVTPVTDPTTVQLPEGFTITGAQRRRHRRPRPVERRRAHGGRLARGSRHERGRDDIETTTVYYSNPADEGIALGMVELLGLGAIELSDAFPGAPVTIVVGADAAG